MNFMGKKDDFKHDYGHAVFKRNNNLNTTDGYNIDSRVSFSGAKSKATETFVEKVVKHSWFEKFCKMCI